MDIIYFTDEVQEILHQASQCSPINIFITSHPAVQSTDNICAIGFFSL